MDFFYDGQIRRYVTQFMRIFIGFKYQSGDGTLKSVPVTYGDMTRQVASIIRDNSENKLPSVPKISCYITGLELDRSRLADASFVSKVSVRERAYNEFDDESGSPDYQNYQGASYTVERLMPTPFMLSMRADIWTSNTDQKLQLLEQILVLFNPSLEVQTTDNYIDWASLSVIELRSSNFSSRTIPAGTESDIDICTIDFEMPIYISPPVKVKKLGVVQNIIMNMFNDAGDLRPLSELAFNYSDGPDPNANAVRVTPGNFGVLLIKSNNGQPNDYDLSVLNPNEAVSVLGLSLDNPIVKHGSRIDWNVVLEQYGGYRAGISQIRFLQSNGNELVGTLTINELDPTYLLVSIEDKPSNTVFISAAWPQGRTTIDAIIDPYKFNPLERSGGRNTGVRYLVLEDINNSNNQGGFVDRPFNANDGSSRDAYNGPRGWKNLNDSDPIVKANSIIEWTGIEWITIFDPAAEYNESIYVQNERTGIQYVWNETQWLKSFEGEYSAGYWSFDLNL
jgi:hypothetical protein